MPDVPSSAQEGKRPISLVSIVGSLRTGSVNAAIARAAIARAPDGVSIRPLDVSGLPFYHGDEEVAGPPESVIELIDAVAACDGVLLFSPEYNSSFPAVTKNVIDWLSRPPRAWSGTPIALITATPGRRAGLGLREHFAVVMEHLPVRLFDTLGIGQSGDRLGPDGELVDETTLAELADHLARFADFCREPAE